MLLAITASFNADDPPGLRGQRRSCPKRPLTDPRRLGKYRTSWLANDPDGVRSCFTEGAVLMTLRGVKPVEACLRKLDERQPHSYKRLAVS